MKNVVVLTHVEVGLIAVFATHEACNAYLAAKHIDLEGGEDDFYKVDSIDVYVSHNPEFYTEK
jgi:hypothetical protein